MGSNTTPPPSHNLPHLLKVYYYVYDTFSFILLYSNLKRLRIKKYLLFCNNFYWLWYSLAFLNIILKIEVLKIILDILERMLSYIVHLSYILLPVLIFFLLICSYFTIDYQHEVLRLNNTFCKLWNNTFCKLCIYILFYSGDVLDLYFIFW